MNKFLATLTTLPAALALVACDMNQGPPEFVQVPAPEWTQRFDTWANKRRCRVTDTVTGERYSMRKYGTPRNIGNEFTLTARRRTCIITEKATGISCRIRGRAGTVSSCSAPNPALNQTRSAASPAAKSAEW